MIIHMSGNEFQTEVHLAGGAGQTRAQFFLHWQGGGPECPKKGCPCAE